MKFAHITTTKNLHFLQDRAYHLTVAPWLKEDRELREFYERKAKRGHFIIVDNGEVEFALSGELDKRMDFEEVLDLANDIGADEVVLPDVFRDRVGTGRRTMTAAKKVPPRMRFVVPQGETFEDWVKCFDFFAKNLSFATIGIAKHCESFEGGRAALLDYLQARKAHGIYNVHMLGVWDNPKEEIAACRPWVRGMDSAVASAYSQRGLWVKNYAGRHLGFKREKGIANTRLLESNMEVIDDWCAEK